MPRDISRGPCSCRGGYQRLYADDTKRSENVLPRLETEIGTMGIDNESHVILYGAVSRTSWNAVMFWALETMGCNSSRRRLYRAVLRRRYRGLADGRGQTEKTASNVQAKTFKAVPGTHRGVKTDELMQVVEGRKEAVIVDVRTVGEYDGTDIRSLRGGHMPTAVNIDYARNFDRRVVSHAAVRRTETSLQGHPCRQSRDHPLPDWGAGGIQLSCPQGTRVRKTLPSIMTAGGFTAAI